MVKLGAKCYNGSMKSRGGLYKLGFVALLMMLVLGSGCCATRPTAALEAGDIVLELQPADQELELIPGESYRGEIKVRDAGRLPLSFTVSTRPYMVSGENYDPDYTTMSDYTQLANWFTFEQTSYQLESGGEAIVNFTITVPTDVPSGGQYAAIIVESRDGVDEDSTFRQVNQLASLVFARVDGGGIREEGQIIEQRLPKIILGGQVTASETVRNTGNVDFKVGHSLSVVDFFTGKEVFGANSRDEEGRVLGSIRQIIFPGTSRTNTLTWSNTPYLGVFRVTETVNLLDQDHVYTQMVFVVPIWLVTLVAAFIGLMVLWIILRIRKRRRRRPQVL